MPDTNFPYHPISLPGNAFTLWLPGRVRPSSSAAAVAAAAPKPVVAGVAPKPAVVAQATGGPPLKLLGGQFTVWTRALGSKPASVIPATAAALPPVPRSSSPTSDLDLFSPGNLAKIAVALVAVGLLFVFFNQNSGLKREKQKLNGEVQALKAGNEETSSQLATANQSLSTMTGKAKGLEQSVADLETAKNTLATEKQTLTTRLTSTVQQLATSKKDAEAKAAALQQNIDGLTKAKSDLQLVADARQADVQKTQAALAEAQKNLKETTALLEKNTADAKVATDALKKEKDTIKADADKLKSSVESATRDKEELRKSVEALVTTIKELEKALAEAKKAAAGQ